MSTRTVTTVDLTPAWRDLLPLLLAMLDIPQTRLTALDELLKMANAADLAVTLTKGTK